MTATVTLLQRNTEYAAAFTGGAPSVEPTLRTIVLCCPDHRVDPAQVLGLRSNEAAVIRHPGGRVTPAFFTQLGVLAAVAAAQGLTTGFELIVLHHTQCGLHSLTPEKDAHTLAGFFGASLEDAADLWSKDPAVTVALDLQRLHDSGLHAPTLPVHGWVYDVATGRVTVVA